MVYAVVQQESGKVQRLVTAKSRLAKTNLAIPRPKLIAGHMAVNLAVNVRNALEGFKMAENIYCWLDSSVALHWLNDDGQYRQKIELSEHDVASCLRNLDASKASGPDGIPARLLKECSSQIAPKLCCLFNLSLNSGRIPSEWKSADATPIHKKESK